MSATYLSLLLLVFFVAFIDTKARLKERQTIDRELPDYWYSLDHDDDFIHIIQKRYPTESSKQTVNSSPETSPTKSQRLTTNNDESKSSKQTVYSSPGTSPMESLRLKTNNSESNKTEDPTFDYEEDSVRFIDKPYPIKSSKQTVNSTSPMESQRLTTNKDKSNKTEEPTFDYEEDSIHFIDKPYPIKSSKQTVNSTSPVESQHLTTNNDESKSSKQTVNSSAGTSPMESQRLRTNNSESRCKEYQNALCEWTTAAAASWLSNYYGDLPAPPERPILGGQPARPKQHPHMASIGFEENKSRIDWACGGSLISERYVLSAAHCSWTKYLGNATWVRLGELDFSSSTDDATPMDVRIEQIIVHPDYKPPSIYNDIVLFKLEEEITFTQYIRPTCLISEQNEMDYVTVTAVGWGQTADDEQRSSLLLDVGLIIIDIDECSKNYGTDRKLYNEGLNSSTMMCAGYPLGGKDTCPGDSGGPLQVRRVKCLNTQIGITSFGRLCGDPNSPGVYTRVSPYIPWIESIVWN